MKMKNLISVICLIAAAGILTRCSSSSKISADDLRAPFIDNQNEIDGCYEKVLKKQPDLGTGVAELKFLINEEGKAYKTIFLKKRSTLNSKLLNACLKKVVSNWQFPSGKNLEVVYPFRFEAKTAPLGDESKTEPAKNEEMDIINTTPPEEGSGDEETPAE